MGPVDVAGTMALLQYLNQEDDNSTGVSAGISGREAPLDPSAPAAKTLALLKMSGIDIEAFIISISPSFNINGEILLQLYYQIAQDGVAYRMSPDRAKVDNPFAIMTRAEMIAKTNIEVQAKNFNFEKSTEKGENLALYQTFRSDPIVANNPKGIYNMAKTLIKSWSPHWSNMVDSILPNPEQFAKEQMAAAAQAVAMYVQKVVMDAKMTGQAPQIDPKQLMAAIQQFKTEAITPPKPEVVKARQEQGAPA
jgi:hypothetical protein